VELAAIARLWSGEEVVRIEGAALTPKALLAEPLEQFRLIHFATHAVASTADPSASAVYLSWGEKLGLDVVGELSLRGRPLVILSACRTGEGELVPGEGIVGLTWAFLRAGARGVVASLWSVDDTATADLMVGMHRGLREGRDVVTALAQAQRALRAERPHPAYWAPMVVVLRPELESPGVGSVEVTQGRQP
jgi:CHAT domain-containing protein